MESQEFKNLKEELNAFQGIRTVKVWNELRENAKSKYPNTVINELDGSGFIQEWLKQWV